MKVVNLIIKDSRNKRLLLGRDYIQNALKEIGYQIICLEGEQIKWPDYRLLNGEKLYIGTVDDDDGTSWLEQEELLLFHTKRPEREGFYLESCPAGLTVICGGDDTGALYGCLELAERIEKERRIPRELAYKDEPMYKLRGPAVGLQKTKIEPPRHTYEYPITPSRFPWFYDKPMWTDFLDRMLKMRCNILYIWSGHPFSSLVKVADYPEALEVTEEEYQKNREVFGWLTRECDRRGIWVVLKFYNIHIPYPFALKHGLDLLQNQIHPLVADYTKKTIKEFIKSFPHIGLMVCLGEALRGTENKTQWFAETIIPAVKEGISEAGIKEEPPVILRGHDCDPIEAMERVKDSYHNLYTMWKYNGEGLTTYFPRGEWQKMHRSLSAIGTTHIINVHILADLEPFRFIAPLYIQKCIQAGAGRLGADGLHLYPLFYWDWPYSPDNTKPRLLQIDRDHFWFMAWFRYAWNWMRDEKEEREYWARQIAEYYGTSLEAGRLLLRATEAAGHCAPKILGRIGITEGNRQTLSLGMTMSQLTNVTRYRPNLELWNSVARRGEQPDEYIKKERTGKVHIGETPYDMIEEVTVLAEAAVKDYKEALILTKNPCSELLRVGTDIEAVYHMSMSYCFKTRAAMEILRYKEEMDETCIGDFSLLERAGDFWKESMKEYEALTQLTEKTYLYANSMQTPQRKIPFPDGGKYGHWKACLVEYQREYECFLKNCAELKAGRLPKKETVSGEIKPLKGSRYELLSEGSEIYTLEKGQSVFTDMDRKLQSIAPELEGLMGVRINFKKAMEGKVSVTLKLSEDCYVLIGYMRAKSIEWLQLPDLETNTHADDRGGLAVVYSGAVIAEGCPVVDIHAYRFEKGVHTLYFGIGGYLIAGVVPANKTLIPRNAGFEGEVAETLDWLYE